MSGLNNEGLKSDINTVSKEHQTAIDPSPASVASETADHEMDDSSTASQLSALSGESKRQKSSSVTSNPTTSDITPDFSAITNQILPPIDDEVIKGTGHYTWEIRNFSKIQDEKVYSPVFTVCGYNFTILMFPKGNANHNLALYLAPKPLTKKVKVNNEEVEVPVDPKWYVCAQFTFILSNPKDSKNNITNTSHQRFNKYATDWGFSNFTDIRNLNNGRKEFGPLLDDDTLHVTAYVKVLEDTTGVLWHNFLGYDSKSETGYVGFNNQGATCYLNSLLQSYYFTKSFRKAVYRIPTADAKPGNSVPLALQRIFYQLQRSNDAIDTEELTKSFGWDSHDSFTQHDVQELNRILMDRLETSMKDTPVEHELIDTFVGHMRSFIKCVNVDYESSRPETFWDIQLNVKNLSNLHDSFQCYINVELLDGENQYNSEQFGLQDAIKGVIFTDFPPVLHLQLKRFEYDFDLDMLVKINDRYEYPPSIDLSPFLDHKTAKKEGKTIGPCIYDLHGVLVHAGDITNGHYYTMIRPDDSDKWYRFDDDRVWRVTEKQVYEDNFGMPDLPINTMTRLQMQSYQMRRHTSAYMLVYIKRDEKSRILHEVTNEDVPEHVAKEIDEELARKEREKQDKADQYLYTNINFYTQALASKFEGFDLGPHARYNYYREKKDLKPFTIKALKTDTFNDILPQLSKGLDIDINKVNFWSMAYRRNGTLRPNNLLEGVDDITIGTLHETRFNSKQSSLNIWLEDIDDDLTVKRIEDAERQEGELDQTVLESNKTLREQLFKTQEILIFVKFFDANNQKLRNLTHIRVSSKAPVKDLYIQVSSILSLPDDTDYKVYEEISPDSIQELNPSKSYDKCEVSSGDILIFEVNKEHSNSNNFYPFYNNAVEYCDYLEHRVVATFKQLNNVEEEEYVLVDKEGGDQNSNKDKSFEIVLSNKATAEELTKRIALKIGKDAEYLKVFFSFANNKYNFKSPMTLHLLQSKGVELNFQYEVLSIPLKELENMQTVRVRWLGGGMIHFQEFEFNVDKNGKVSDLLDKLAGKVNLDEHQKSQLFLWDTFHNKFHMILYPWYKIEQITSEFDVYASVEPTIIEPLKFYTSKPEEEEDIIDENSDIRPIPVIHFNRDPNRRTHGISFVFHFRKDETLTEVVKRLQNKLGLGLKEFSKIKLCFWDGETQPIYFKNPVIDPAAAANKETNEAQNIENSEIDPENFIPLDVVESHFYLCLDHPENHSNRPSAYSGAGGISIR